MNVPSIVHNWSQLINDSVQLFTIFHNIAENLQILCPVCVCWRRRFSPMCYRIYWLYRILNFSLQCWNQWFNQYYLVSELGRKMEVQKISLTRTKTFTTFLQMRQWKTFDSKTYNSDCREWSIFVLYISVAGEFVLVYVGNPSGGYSLITFRS